MADENPRRWYQLHLITLVVVTLATAAVMTVNFCTVDSGTSGWPLTCFQWDGTSLTDWNVKPLLINAGVLVSIQMIVAVWMERYITFYYRQKRDILIEAPRCALALCGVVLIAAVLGVSLEAGSIWGLIFAAICVHTLMSSPGKS